MKGFPNQVAGLEKLARGVRCVAELLGRGENPRNDRILGEALVRAGVIGTGHRPMPVEEYIQAQALNRPDRQSLQTSARGLRELYRLLGLIEEHDREISLTSNGDQAVAFAGEPLDNPQIEFWRRIIRDFQHHGGQDTASHPYQVLLRLVARKPGITRAKCALALEARDDTSEELDRIAGLADLTEEQIRERIGVSRSNWDNAKKVIPRFAEQLGDVIKDGQTYRLADAPGTAPQEGEPVVDAQPAARRPAGPRRPRASRLVTPATIGMAGIVERDEPQVPPDLDPAAAAEAAQLRRDRLRRHNQLVRLLAGRLQAAQMTLFEDPFDVLGLRDRVAILGEVKTLDGTEEDERDRVRDALAQLLYYEAFVITPIADEVAIHKVACFERPISVAHQGWLNGSEIMAIWPAEDGFTGDELARRTLSDFFEEFR